MLGMGRKYLKLSHFPRNDNLRAFRVLSESLCWRVGVAMGAGSSDTEDGQETCGVDDYYTPLEKLFRRFSLSKLSSNEMSAFPVGDSN